MIFLLSAILPIPSLPPTGIISAAQRITNSHGLLNKGMTLDVIVSKRILKLLTLFNLVRNSQFVNFYYQLLVNWTHLLLLTFLCYQTFLPLFLITVENTLCNLGIHLLFYLCYKMRQLFQAQRQNLFITKHLDIRLLLKFTFQGPHTLL